MPVGKEGQLERKCITSTKMNGTPNETNSKYEIQKLTHTHTHKRQDKKDF